MDQLINNPQVTPISTPPVTPPVKATLGKGLGQIKTFLATADLKRDKRMILAFIAYLAFLTFLHWWSSIISFGLNTFFDICFFWAGGLLGINFLNLAESIFQKSALEAEAEHSPFKNVLFQVVFVPLAFFIMTSSGSLFGAGMIFTIFLGMIIEEYQILMKNGNLGSWFWPVKTTVENKTQTIYFLVMVGFLVFFSLLFL